ncbi:MAG TPA: lipoprotein [Burkholderiaceae bacterium]|nr:lipoprotein [Burkholderiaceae bacterium]
MLQLVKARLVRVIASAIVLTTAVVAGLAACGQKGPLFVPGVPAGSAWPYPSPSPSPTSAPASSPAPAAPSTSDVPATSDDKK